MPSERPEMRSWLAEALASRTRHPALEDTLFHRLHELEQGPLQQLGELVHLVIDELRVAQRRLAEQAGDLSSLQRSVAVLSGRLDDLSGGQAVAPPDAPVDGHVLLLGHPEGYRLLERDGAAPAPGDEVEAGGARYRVLNRGSSPLPGDPRPGVIALPAP
jgi:hypothetical protein